MPAVLIETGFLSNHDEEKVLKSEQGQERITNSIFKAFSEYRSKVMQSRYKRLDELNVKEEKKIEVRKPSILYGVQIAAARKIDESAYPEVPDKHYLQSGDFYKYISGSYPSKEKAEEALGILKRQGFKKAFIIALDNK